MQYFPCPLRPRFTSSISERRLIFDGDTPQPAEKTQQKDKPAETSIAPKTTENDIKAADETLNNGVVAGAAAGATLGATEGLRAKEGDAQTNVRKIEVQLGRSPLGAPDAQLNTSNERTSTPEAVAKLAAMKPDSDQGPKTEDQKSPSTEVNPESDESSVTQDAIVRFVKLKQDFIKQKELTDKVKQGGTDPSVIVAAAHMDHDAQIQVNEEMLKNFTALYQDGVKELGTYRADLAKEQRGLWVATKTPENEAKLKQLTEDIVALDKVLNEEKAKPEPTNKTKPRATANNPVATPKTVMAQAAPEVQRAVNGETADPKTEAVTRATESINQSRAALKKIAEEMKSVQRESAPKMKGGKRVEQNPDDVSNNTKKLDALQSDAQKERDTIKAARQEIDGANPPKTEGEGRQRALRYAQQDAEDPTLSGMDQLGSYLAVGMALYDLIQNIGTHNKPYDALTHNTQLKEAEQKSKEEIGKRATDAIATRRASNEPIEKVHVKGEQGLLSFDKAIETVNASIGKKLDNKKEFLTSIKDKATEYDTTLKELETIQKKGTDEDKKKIPELEKKLADLQKEIQDPKTVAELKKLNEEKGELETEKKVIEKQKELVEAIMKKRGSNESDPVPLPLPKENEEPTYQIEANYFYFTLPPGGNGGDFKPNDGSGVVAVEGKAGTFKIQEKARVVFTSGNKEIRVNFTKDKAPADAASANVPAAGPASGPVQSPRPGSRENSSAEEELLAPGREAINKLMKENGNDINKVEQIVNASLRNISDKCTKAGKEYDNASQNIKKFLKEFDAVLADIKPKEKNHTISPLEIQKMNQMNQELNKLQGEMDEKFQQELNYHHQLTELHAQSLVISQMKRSGQVSTNTPVSGPKPAETTSDRSETKLETNEEAKSRLLVEIKQKVSDFIELTSSLYPGPSKESLQPYIRRVKNVINQFGGNGGDPYRVATELRPAIEEYNKIHPSVRSNKSAEQIDLAKYISEDPKNRIEKTTSTTSSQEPNIDKNNNLEFQLANPATVEIGGTGIKAGKMPSPENGAQVAIGRNYLNGPGALEGNGVSVVWGSDGNLSIYATPEAKGGEKASVLINGRFYTINVEKTAQRKEPVAKVDAPKASNAANVGPASPQVLETPSILAGVPDGELVGRGVFDVAGSKVEFKTSGITINGREYKATTPNPLSSRLVPLSPITLNVLAVQKNGREVTLTAGAVGQQATQKFDEAKLALVLNALLQNNGNGSYSAEIQGKKVTIS